MVPATSLVRRSNRNVLADKETVLCITPPSIFLQDERVFMSLGMIKVAAVLEKAGHPVEHVDLSGIANYEEVVQIAVSQTAARAVLISVTTPQLPAAVRIVAAIRSVAPGLRIVCGGPHPTLVHSAVKLERKASRIGRAAAALRKLEGIFDVLVSGDGEISVFEALKPGCDKVIDADVPKGGMFMDNEIYENTPWPARHLVDVASYKYSIEGFPSTSLVAQLGCPFGCGFCGGRNSSMLRRIRTRSTANVVAEIEHLHRTYGFTGFQFYDDELNVNKNMVELMDAISALQDRLKTEFRLRGFVKSELFTEEQAISMRRAGFRWILCGFEAANPRILVNINKRATREDNDRVIEIAKKHNLKTKALMSVGHCGETAESIEDVKQWLLTRKPEEFDCTSISTYPGTPYWDEAVPHASRDNCWTYTHKTTGDHLHSIDVDYCESVDHYKGRTDDGYHSYCFTDALSGDDIVRLRDDLEKEVREKLGIPPYLSPVAQRYEHSMGQGLPGNIFRKTGT